MMVNEQGDTILMVAQTDHSELAGQFAAFWGNDSFARLDPYSAMVTAAGEHDNGWREWELNPRLNEKTGKPQNFLGMDTDQFVEIYDRGIRRAAEVDPYAGLIVSMHGSGLLQQRYGLFPAMRGGKPPSTPAEKKFVAEQESFQKQLGKELLKHEKYGQVSSKEHIWENYKLLQILCRLSQRFAGQRINTPDDNIAPVPRTYFKEDVTLIVKDVEPGTVMFSPYPFRHSPARFLLRARLIPNQVYKSEAEFREVYHQAERIELSFKAVVPS